MEKKKRGRPRKNPLPEEIQRVVSKIEEEEHEEFLKIVLEVKAEKKDYWDIKKDDPIKFFDASLSYELTGYRPINDKQGLDFEPKWFTEARDTFLRTGHYCGYHPNTKAYADYWTQQYIYCRDGMVVNGYTITGDHYYFLNFYLLANLETSKAGEGRQMSFPDFYVAQYEWFHYLELAKRLRLNAVLMKARGIGFSEMDASLAAGTYNTRRNSNVVIAANILKYRDDTLSKTWNALSFSNDFTDGGFFKLRQVHDKDDWKRASFLKKVNGQEIETGWMSLIRGITADRPNKIRGDRCDILLYEELGSWADSQTAFIQGDALVGIQGTKFGIKIGGGTGGDSGPKLEGLRKIYYDPEGFEVLPYRHRYTLTGEEMLTAFFVPSHIIVKNSSDGLYMDSRGYTNPEEGKKYYDAKRARLAHNPKALMAYCAEYCYNAEEAFSQEGENKFNKIVIAELLVKIRALKMCPQIDKGYFTFLYFTGKPRKVEGGNISAVVWHNDDKLGNVKILEHPMWTDLYKNKKEEEKLNLINDGEDIPPIDSIPILNALYVAGVDGIDIGSAQTSAETREPSDFCITIFKRVYGIQDPQIVAIYKDRPADLREAYQTAIALAMYYNCLINIEATRMSFCNWAKSVKLLNYFMKRPRATYPDINKIKSTQYGSPATQMVIEHLTDLIANFVEDYGYNIWFEEVLDELSRYSDEAKRKFDIIASLGMCMLADEELQGITPRAVVLEQDDQINIGYYIDENGHKRFGLIPDKNKNVPKYNPNYYEDDTGTIRTSNPRLFYGGVW